jgi:hypothetical protein
MKKALAISLALLVSALSVASVAEARELERKIPMFHEPATQVASRGDA